MRPPGLIALTITSPFGLAQSAILQSEAGYDAVAIHVGKVAGSGFQPWQAQVFRTQAIVGCAKKFNDYSRERMS